MKKESQAAEQDVCRIGFGFDVYWGWEVTFSTENYETEDKTSVFYTDRIPCIAVKKLFTRWDTYGDCDGQNDFPFMLQNPLDNMEYK